MTKRLSDSTRNCIEYIALSGLIKGFNRGDIPAEHSIGLAGLVRASYLKRHPSGYILTTEGHRYMKLMRLI